jgi:NDP-sugar pyrophosphorylase family protein
MEFVTQELDKIPSGFSIHPEREKPWGTAHAVMMAKEKINGPFCVINSDDYYGTEAYKTLVEFFNTNQDQDRYAVVAYYLRNTLSEHGSVNRGVCKANDQGDLEDIEECVGIHREADGLIRFPAEEGSRTLDEDALVSMNMFGFNPSFFEHSERLFKQFLEVRGMELKSEFFIPWALDQLIKAGDIHVSILESPSKWFGVTYQEDKPIVMEKLNALIRAGVYPNKLW